MGAVGASKQERPFVYHRLAWGQRPAAWWDYEAPGMRRPSQGSTESLYGGAGVFKGRFKGIYNVKTMSDYPIYEDQSEYLERLNLLMPGEKEKIEKQEKAEADDLKGRGLR